MKERFNDFITWCRKFPEPMKYYELSKPFWKYIDEQTSDPTWGAIVAMLYLPVILPMSIVALCETIIIPFVFLQRSYVKLRIRFRKQSLTKADQMLKEMEIK